MFHQQMFASSGNVWNQSKTIMIENTYAIGSAQQMQNASTTQHLNATKPLFNENDQ